MAPPPLERKAAASRMSFIVFEGRAGNVAAVALVAVVVRAVVEHGDAIADQLDMAEFLGGDRRDQAVERTQLVLAAEIEALEQVVPERGHLAVFAAEQFLERGSGIGVLPLRCGQFDLQFVNSHKHLGSPLDGGSGLERASVSAGSGMNQPTVDRGALG